jgi:serine phosphatase RsbU (regulator of sigma subunit)
MIRQMSRPSAKQQSPWLLPLRLLAILSLVIGLVASIGSLRLVGEPFAGFRFEPTLTVSAQNDTAWNGPRAGLATYDRILSADGEPLETPEELTRLVRSLPVGTAVTYEILREGKTQTAVVATQRFTFRDFFSSFLPMILAGILYLLVGGAAFWMRPSQAAAQAHLGMTVAVGLFLTLTADFDTTQWFTRAYLLVLWLMGSSFIHLALVFPEPKRFLMQRPWLAYAAYLPAVAGATAWNVSFRHAGHAASPEGVDAYLAGIDMMAVWLLLGLVALIGGVIHSALKGRTALSRLQSKTALFGAATAFLPGALIFVVPLMAGQVSQTSNLLINLSFLCFVLFPLSIAYAIVKHKMFDIDLVIKRTMVYAAVVAALAGVYFLTIALVRGGIDLLFGASGSTAGNILATAVVAMAFVPVRNRIQRVVDRLFFRNRYDFRGVLSAYTQFAKENPELDAVVSQYLEVAEETMHPRHMSVMVRDPRTRALLVHETRGLNLFPDGFAIPADTPEISELFQARRTGMRPSKATTRQLSHMDALGISFCVPLEIKGEILGMINFGPKLSELEYSTEDQQLLVNMGQQLASVIRIAEMTKAEVNRARLDAELETARHIQASLLPAAAPAPDGLEVMGSSVSAYEFGGDYYDLVTLHDGLLRVVVGDVAGKGVQAAMVMAMAKSCFFNQVRSNPDLATVMTAINRMIVETIVDKKHRKTTLIYGVIDPAAKTLRYSCAGHQAPHYFNAEKGCVEDLPIPGSFPFGASKLAKYQEIEVSLHSGDVLVFYTDGVTEAANPEGEMFYELSEAPDGTEIVMDHLKDVIELHHARSAQEIHHEIVKAVERWVDGGPQGDDITLVVVKIL